MQSLKLVDLHMKHLEAKQMGATQAVKIEEDFEQEWEKFQAIFSTKTMMEVDSFYGVKLWRAVQYFGVPEDDPVRKQLALALGNTISKRAPNLKTDAGVVGFTGESTSSSSSSGSVVAFTPGEFPAPPANVLDRKLSSEHVQMRGRYRPHWVLQEPEIALTKEDLKFDPW